MNMLRVWPIVCEFGVGALLCLVGIWCGLRGGYLNLKIAEDLAGDPDAVAERLGQDYTHSDDQDNQSNNTNSAVLKNSFD